MQIKCVGNGNCEIRTKNAVVYTDPAKINDFSFDHEGEYEIANVMVEGIQIDDEHTIFVFNVEDVKITHLDGLSRKLDNKELEFLSTADVLIVPYNENKTMSTEQIQEIVNMVDPKIVILANFKNLDELTKAFGNVENQTILKLSKSNLPTEGRQIFALE